MKRPFVDKRVYPLAALVGQDKVRMALLLLAVDPGLGGVLLVGQKGTAKSTAVRALAELLPALNTVSGCPYHCDPDVPGELCPACAGQARADMVFDTIPTPLLTLPLGATEDRVVGGLDFERSIRTGKAFLAPGLLGQANRGFLYIDEVNLLEPYLAHLLLDTVESGRLVLEREGLSGWHPARTALIGTMNPEEGPLGPQLADRFALIVPVTSETDPDLRSEIVRRRLAFEADPVAFRLKWANKSRDIAERIVAARDRLPQVALTGGARKLISLLVKKALAPGHRGDLALARSARALAAWDEDPRAIEDHVLAVSALVLDSRRRIKKKRQMEARVIPVSDTPEVTSFEAPYIPPTPLEPPPATERTGDKPDGPEVKRLYHPHEKFTIITPTAKREKGPRERSGRRAARVSTSARGRYFRSSPQRLGRPVALDATLRAAAPYQNSRKRARSASLVIRKPDVREKVFRQKTGRLVLFVVDASGSVGSLERMSEAKAATLSLLSEAYIKRDRVGLISFHGDAAQTLLPPTNSVEMASRLLKDLPTGGKTPMAAALVVTERMLRVELARDPGLTPTIVIMTDGRPNVPLAKDVDPWKEVLQMARMLARDRRLQFLVVDTDRGHYNDYKMTHDLAVALNAPRLTLEDLRQGRLEQWLERGNG